jgi:hypothetical protein
LKYFLWHTLLSIIAGAALLIIAQKFRPVDEKTVEGIVIGFLIAAVFVCAGFFSFYLGMKSGERTFNLIFFGSISVRLFLAAATLIILIRFTRIDTQAMLISMFSWYLVLQIGEVIGFHRISLRKV